jgi:protein TonB
VLASLVLHALILLLLPVLREAQPRRAAPPIEARLTKPKPPPEPPKAEPLPPPVARAVPKAPPRPAPAPTPAPVLSMAPKPAAEAPAFVVPAPPPQPPVAQPAPAPVAKAEPAPGASGPDPGTLAQFRIDLMQAASRYKRYPRIAQDNNWEGRVELRIAFSETGAISAMTVRKGAGRTVLDDEAQAMIRTARPQVVIPPALRGKAFTVDVAVDFLLRDDR